MKTFNMGIYQKKKLIDILDLSNEPNILNTMKWGGKRKGAGRNKKEPTKTVRVPLSKLSAVFKLIGKA